MTTHKMQRNKRVRKEKKSVARKFSRLYTEMAEWSKATVSKTVCESAPWVRILLSVQNQGSELNGHCLLLVNMFDNRRHGTKRVCIS